MDLDLLPGIPIRGEGEDPLLGQASGEEIDEIRPGIIGIPLLGENLDVDARIQLPERLGGHCPGQAVADDEDSHFAPPSPASGDFLEEVLAHSALGTDPGVGQVFKSRPGRIAVLRVPFFGIINVAARRAFPFSQGRYSFPISF